MDAFRAGLLLITALLSTVVGSGVDLTQRRIEQMAHPYAWSLVGWEGSHLAQGLALIVAQLQTVEDDEALGHRVEAYLRRNPGEARDADAPLLASAVARGLRRLGAPTVGPLVFPPVTLAMAEPPRLLVVSPRERIHMSHWLILDGRLPGISFEDLEHQVERLGVSALVVDAVALGTYPVLIPVDTPPRFALRTVAHEWTHVALFPSRLGLAYGSSAEARAINETSADLVGEEVAAAVLAEGGIAFERTPPADESLRQALREIRVRAEELLAGGQVAEAEQYMEEARRALEDRGYRLRRLNQAYFAFHGSYAEGPALSTEIPDALRSLRSRSADLADFLAAVGQLSSIEDLRRAVGTADERK